MKTIVLYQSQTGFTKTYAEWIGKALTCRTAQADQIADEELGQYDAVIYGAGIYAGQIAGLKEVRGRLTQAQKRRWVIFATGAIPVGDVKTVEKLKRENLTEQEQGEIPLFYFQGGLDYSRMKPSHRMMMWVMRRMMKKKAKEDEKSRQMLEAISHSFDGTNQESIDPLVKAVRKLENEIL